MLLRISVACDFRCYLVTLLLISVVGFCCCWFLLLLIRLLLIVAAVELCWCCCWFLWLLISVAVFWLLLLLSVPDVSWWLQEASLLPCDDRLKEDFSRGFVALLLCYYGGCPRFTKVICLLCALLVLAAKGHAKASPFCFTKQRQSSEFWETSWLQAKGWMIKWMVKWFAWTLACFVCDPAQLSVKLLGTFVGVAAQRYKSRSEIVGCSAFAERPTSNTTLANRFLAALALPSEVEPMMLLLTSIMSFPRWRSLCIYAGLATTQRPPGCHNKHIANSSRK